MRKLFFLAFLIAPFAGNTQEEKCNCQQVFDSLTKKLEANYLGLKQAELANLNTGYLKRKVTYRQEAASVKSENCTKFLENFLSYLKDKHVFVYEEPTYTNDELAIYKTAITGSKKNTEELRTLLKKQYNPNSITGRWTDGTSEFAIVKEKKDFRAYILKSGDAAVQPGELKAVFTIAKDGFDALLYASNYAPSYRSAALYKEATLLSLGAGKLWGRLESPYTRELNMINYKDIPKAVIQKLDEQNVLFSIPTFNYDWAAFNQLVQDNMQLLTNTPNLIFDIRGNTGGNALYFSLVEILSDTTVFPGSQGYVLASQDNKNYFERQLKNSPALFQPLVDSISTHMGEIIDGPLYPNEPLTLIPNKIKHIAILCDKANLSAAESFILHTRAVSQRLTTFGEPTGGCIDYTSVNTITLPSGSQHIIFGYPTSTWNKEVPEKGYNKTGIIPDIAIEHRVKDKIAFVINYFGSAKH